VKTQIIELKPRRRRWQSYKLVSKLKRGVKGVRNPLGLLKVRSDSDLTIQCGKVMERGKRNVAG
jgi:hypothetical protein